VSRKGFSASETKACSTWLSIGRVMPAIAATCEECPATAMPTLPAAMAPRDVSTWVMRPPARRNPVTSQFWMMSTPSRSAARA
jgi:hypothetical protein